MAPGEDSQNTPTFTFWTSPQKIFEPAVMAANRWESDGESSDDDDDDDELPKRKKRCLPSPTRASSRPGGVRQWAYGRMTKSWKHYQTHLPRPRGWPRRRTWWQRECGKCRTSWEDNFSSSSLFWIKINNLVFYSFWMSKFY